jgi:diguanylate cyclase (GGDEF)-like protein
MKRQTVLLMACCLLPASLLADELTVRVQLADGAAPVAGAVVYLNDGSKPSPVRSEVFQKDRMFHPHVLILPAGSSVDFPNQDNTQHHVYSFSPAKTFNLELYADKPEAPVVFDQPGIVELGCNIHDHMQAFIVVADSRAIGQTNEQGEVTIALDFGDTQVPGSLMMVYLFEDEKRRALEQLTIAERLTTEVIERRNDLELSRLDVVVRDFGFRSAIASRNPATLNSALENHSGRVDADFALLLDSQGQLLASTLTQTIPGITETQLATARKNGADRSLLTINQRGYEVLVIPVEAPGLRAWLVAGFELDQELANVIALLTARHLGRPVLQLAHYARAVGQGENPPAPDIRTGGELRQLRDTLRDTLARLIRRETEIRHAATHDEVTGLGNRNALLQKAEDGFSAGKPCSLIGLRVSDLSDINDTLGLEFGDKILLSLSQRLRDELPDASLIARTGGGEFLALIPKLSPEALEQLALALRNIAESPLNIDNTPFSLRASLITLQLPADASQTNELRRRVNLTFEQALQKGVAVARYEPGQDENHLRELKLVSDLHSAIRHDGLHMNYQPKLDNGTGQLLQVEALVRWIHPELGFISPEEFIFLAEQSGQINDLTDHILQKVANDARAWFNTGLDAGVAINLSAMGFWGYSVLM